MSRPRSPRSRRARTRRIRRRCSRQGCCLCSLRRPGRTLHGRSCLALMKQCRLTGGIFVDWSSPPPRSCVQVRSLGAMCA
eukprot:6378203-Pyramimonas_sp.AAC.1